jgi:signal peptidase I
MFTVKETVTSVIIAFIMAFVARGFVIEAFLIPTGSMAPTLMGAHVRVTGPNTGYSWPVGPNDFSRADSIPLPVQNYSRLTDPMEGASVAGAPAMRNLPRMAGDRIFVLKYLYSVFDPRRFDVVVFKNPTDPRVNFIKRLVGLPGEQIALVDGDVFVRPMQGPVAIPTGPDPISGLDTWSGEGWTIARKPERVQREVWQTVFNSEFTPKTWLDGKPGFRQPWKAGAGDGNAGWKIQHRASYEHSGGKATLEWDNTARAINDIYPYNENRQSDQTMVHPMRGAPKLYPVSDIRVSFGLESKSAGVGVGAVLTTRGHEFRVRIVDGFTVELAMRPAARRDSSDEPWKLMHSGAIQMLPVGKVVNLEFWFVDQSLQLWVDGSKVAAADIPWSLKDRVAFTMGPLEELLKGSAGDVNRALIRTEIYPRPSVKLEFDAPKGFTLHRVALDRDLYYQPDIYISGEKRPEHSKIGQPALATHPIQTPTLGPDEFFVCGDNSPASADGRLWDSPDPWVARQFDERMGVVARQMLIGRAFFVYFPSPHTNHRFPVPDVGRMRWIW